MASALPSLAGARFGELLVLTEISRGKWGRRWLSACNCGNFTTSRQGDLRSGQTSSCGCKRENSKRTHGMSKTPEYTAWRDMRGRCENPKLKSYPSYGGRGITVCEGWRESFQSFLADMGLRPSPKHSVERIDVNKGYGPDNCCWATVKEQARNTTRTIRVVVAGEAMCLSDAAEKLGLNYGCLQQRVYHGASPEEAIAKEASKAAITAALADGPIPGAAWSNPIPVLTVRTR